ncbi:killer cell lectin-like receptor subfamily B member 1C [Numenius arquata]|uniref:killer cell lectin-like receptor subfamily B member 1C n=1 Tax=Numenius arquata TaxID=31919 RepID=UPI003D306F50
MEDEDGYMALEKRWAAGKPAPLRGAGSVLRDPQGVCAPRRASVLAGAPHHSCCLLGTLTATLALSLMVCEEKGCTLCPTNWTLRGTKCYWASRGMSPWNSSREDCGKRGGKLLMLEDQEELDFVNEILQKPTRYFWIGLLAGKGWTWLNGSRLDPSRFQLSPRDEGGSCGVIREGRISPESCGSAVQWVCQKEATQL